MSDLKTLIFFTLETHIEIYIDILPSILLPIQIIYFLTL